jgi:hypothetical protein
LRAEGHDCPFSKERAEPAPVTPIEAARKLRDVA